jgi:hypothetical protein
LILVTGQFDFIDLLDLGNWKVLILETGKSGGNEHRRAGVADSGLAPLPGRSA